MAEGLAIVGGMGPRASAEFVKTLYEFNCGEVEQESLCCVLYSDPAFPDRTESILGGLDLGIVKRLTDVLLRLRQLVVCKTVLCCVTLHHFLTSVPEDLRQDVISLVDLIIDEASSRKTPQLLLCTSGTRKARIFEEHPRWELARPFVQFPDARDQTRVDDLLYRIKKRGACESMLAELDDLCRKYGVESLVAGCTEVHLLTTLLRKGGSEAWTYRILDPLLMLANDAVRYLR